MTENPNPKPDLRLEMSMTTVQIEFGDGTEIISSINREEVREKKERLHHDELPPG